MKTSTLYGVALIVGTIASVATMAFHPTQIPLNPTPAELAHEMRELVAVHALGLLSIPIMVFGFFGVTQRLGGERPAALFAFIVYAFSAIAIMLAAIADGLVNAALIPASLGATEPEMQKFKAALLYNYQFNQGCAKVFVFGSSLAIIFWSSELMRVGSFERGVGIFGCLISMATLAGVLSGQFTMSAHGFGVIVFLQALWIVSLGISMLRVDRDTLRPIPLADKVER